MGLGVERLEVEGLGSTRLLTPLRDEEGGATGTGNHTSFLAAHWLPEMNGARSEPIADKLDFPGGVESTLWEEDLKELIYLKKMKKAEVFVLLVFVDEIVVVFTVTTRHSYPVIGHTQASLKGQRL